LGFCCEKFRLTDMREGNDGHTPVPWRLARGYWLLLPV
jgi:hypothetical protein